MDLTEVMPSKIMFELEEISHFKAIEDNQEQYVMGNSNKTLLLLNIFFVTSFRTINKQGKSEGFDSCNRPSNLT